ncbi:hypothetical protein [Streptomyces sp. NPDC057545]|uniref:hypothetical protein n=1 Tax=Streptomyces sp. NPDC057545 TaxID=3346164 RepID=UPI000940373D|nr:hypothetical protein AMK22_30855 [Streptomyces sp. CB01580]
MHGDDAVGERADGDNADKTGNRIGVGDSGGAGGAGWTGIAAAAGAGAVAVITWPVSVRPGVAGGPHGLRGESA